MSGISVAKTLYDNGVKNFTIIEGSSRIGGRMKSVSLSGQTVNLGAMWVYGKGSNPVYEILQRYNISMSEDNSESKTVRDSFGHKVTNDATMAEERLSEVMDLLDELSKAALKEDAPDFAAASRLRYLNWLPKTAIEDVMEIFTIDFEFGVPSPYISGKHAYWWAPYEAFDSKQTTIVKDARGFESLQENMGKRFLGEDRIEKYLELNKIVTRIEQTTKDGVNVFTKDGSRYHGDYAVITFSLGVLQNKEVTFTPELPECKTLATASFGMFSIAHIYLQFPYTFWDDTSYILFASEQRGKNSIWMNMNDIISGSNILQLSLFEEEARRIERLDDQTIVSDLMATLRSIYPNHVIPLPNDFAIPRWTYDPLFHGAYSYWPTGFTENNMADMIAPYGRVYFAVEHLDPIQYSFVRGAYASGIKTANDILKCLENALTCSATIDKNVQRCSQRLCR